MKHPSKRILGLDILRSGAVFLVLAHHFEFEEQYLPMWLFRIMDALQRGGYVGVHLFFVLSGFLVTSLLIRDAQKNNTVATGRFLLRRGWKIYPAYFSFMLLSYVVLLQTDPSIFQILGDLLFLQNYLDSIWNHTWTLAVEEHYYLAIAVAFWIAQKRGQLARFIASLPRLGSLICAVCLTIKLLVFYFVPEGPLYINLETHVVFDALLFGSVLAPLYCNNWEGIRPVLLRFRFFIILAVILGLLPTFSIKTPEGLIFPLLYSINYVLFGALVMLSLALQRAPQGIVGGLASALGWIGKYSYTIYLTHYPVVLVAMKMVKLKPEATMLIFFVYLLISGVLGFALAELVEVPALRLRDRLVPSRDQKIT
jgi:peptidoglycan/LPS O-acetylase OafA/YrhL